MRIVAHRGLHRSFPENTIGAFEAAAAAGADGVELDVRLTRDHVPVVIHDLEVDHYLEGVRGYVFDHDLADLQAAPIRGSPAGAPQRVPTLEEVLAAFAGRIGLEVELKDPGPDLVHEVARVLEPFHAASSGIEVTSFEPAALSAIASLAPALWTCLLAAASKPWMTPAMLSHRVIGQARLASAGAVHLHHSQLDGAVVGAVRDAGLEVHAWDVNDEAALARASRFGVTAVDTDEPERMLELRTRSA